MDTATNQRHNFKNKFQKQKSLPTHVPKGQGQTCVVRLKKIAGQMYQDCDVYIGPKMNNPHWKFDKSIWVNKYHYDSDDREENLKKYEKYVRGNAYLKDNLKFLKGKRLGCFCENLDFCHGAVLVKLVKEFCSANYIKINDILFFKGEHSPFSNIWLGNFLSNDGTTYNSSEQLRLSLVADRVNNQELLREVMSCKSVQEICKISKEIALTCAPKISQQNMIKDMIKSIQMKFKRNSDFRWYCLKHVQPGTILFEATKNCFWGCGKDISEIDTHDTLESFDGYNLVGWILMFVIANFSLWGYVLQEISMLDDFTLDDKLVESETISLDNSLDRSDKTNANQSSLDPPSEKSCKAVQKKRSHGVVYLQELMKKRFNSTELTSTPMQGLKMLLTVLEEFSKELEIYSRW